MVFTVVNKLLLHWVACAFHCAVHIAVVVCDFYTKFKLIILC